MGKNRKRENIQRAPITAEDIKQRSLKLSEKKLDFFHSLSKFTYTAIVLGAVYSILQDENMKVLTGVYIVCGILITYILYLIGNSFLKR